MRFLNRDEARDWAAILYTPVLTVLGAVLAFAFIYGPWPPETAQQRLTFLGWTLIGLMGLIALGTLFLQRRMMDVKVKTAAGEFELDNLPAGPTPTA